MTAVLSEIIEILVGGLTGIASGIGSGLTSLVEAIFLEKVTSGSTTTTQLSTFGAVIIVFAGISLAIGLSRWVVGWVTSLGAHN